MANLSDAFGDITVTKVGKEFIDYLKVVQDKDAYYTLVDNDTLSVLKPDSNGDLDFPFANYGRWAYSSNLYGYLAGKWMDNEPKQRKAYDKFVTALKKKGGSVVVEYEDSDTSMDWMGSGTYSVTVEDGELLFGDDFKSESVTMLRFAEVNGEDEYWALEYLYGDEVARKYDEYVEQWKKDHSDPKFAGMEAASPSEWYDNEYQEEE